MGSKDGLGPAVQTIAAKIVLFMMEAEVQEERQGRQKGERAYRKGPVRTRTESHDPRQLRQEQPDENRPNQQEGRIAEIKNWHTRQKQNKNKNIKQDHTNSEPTGGNKLISTLSIVDLMYKVEDAIRWDKYSSQTKILVDKFREELKKNYIEHEEAAKGEGGKRKRCMTIRKRGENGSGEGKCEPVLKEDLVQEVEQVLASHLGKDLPPASSTWEIGDIPKEWEIFVTGIPVSENVLDTAVSEGIVHFNRNRKKKMQQKGYRKRSVINRKEPKGTNSVKQVTLQAVPIACPEESLTSIHFEKEPETYINVAEESNDKQEGRIAARECGDLEGLSKMVEEMSRIGGQRQCQEIGENEESEKHFLASTEFTCNSEEYLWHDAQSFKENSIEEIKSENNNPEKFDNVENENSCKEKYSMTSNGKSSLNDVLEPSDEIEGNCEQSSVFKMTEDGEKNLENSKFGSNEQAIQLNAMKEEHILTKDENANHEDKNEVIKILERKVINLHYEPFVEVKETTGTIIGKYSKNKTLKNTQSNTKEQHAMKSKYNSISKSGMCTDFLNSLSLYPWFKRVYVSPVTGKLIGYMRRENFCLKINKPLYQATAYNQIEREWVPGNCATHLLSYQQVS